MVLWREGMVGHQEELSELPFLHLHSEGPEVVLAACLNPMRLGIE